MALGRQRRAVGVFNTRAEAEHALNELRNSGFSMSRISVMARDADGRGDIAGVDVQNKGSDVGGGAAAGAIAGGAVGGLVGLLGALSALTIPGVGPVLAGGAIASILGDTLIGGAIGAATGSLVGALMGLGIPEDRAKVYDQRFNQGGYLVFVDGTEDEIRRAEAILHQGGIQEWGVYDHPDHPATSTSIYDDPSFVGTPAYAPGMGLGTVESGMGLGATSPGSSMGTLGYDPTYDYGTGRPRERHRRAVGVFSRRADAERALHELRDSGFPMNAVSVVAKDDEGQGNIGGVDVHDRVDDNKADEGAKTGALAGGALGGLTGLLVGLGLLAIPGVGPIMLAGATATALATTISGGAIGAAAGGLLGALIGLGIPEDRARVYNDRLSRGDYLVMVDGTDEEISRAETILNNRGIEDYGVYDIPVNQRRPIETTDAVVDRPHTTQNVGASNRVERDRRAVGVFSSRARAEAALNELRDSNFPMRKVSVIAKDGDHKDDIAGVDVKDRKGNKADKGAATGATTGGILGGLGGLLVGLGALAIPGIGPVMLGGAAATALATTLSGGAIGAAAGGLVGALVGMGIPEERAKVYNDRLSRGDYLVMIDGDTDEIHRAETILHRHHIEEFGIYDKRELEGESHRGDYVASDSEIHPSTTTTGTGSPTVTVIDNRDNRDRTV